MVASVLYEDVECNPEEFEAIIERIPPNYLENPGAVSSPRRAQVSHLHERNVVRREPGAWRRSTLKTRERSANKSTPCSLHELTYHWLDVNIGTLNQITCIQRDSRDTRATSEI